jgi:hypothetical protein
MPDGVFGYILMLPQKKKTTLLSNDFVALCQVQTNVVHVNVNSRIYDV